MLGGNSGCRWLLLVSLPENIDLNGHLSPFVLSPPRKHPYDCGCLELTLTVLLILARYGVPGGTRWEVREEETVSPKPSTACQSHVDVRAHTEAVGPSLDSQMGPVFLGDGEDI